METDPSNMTVPGPQKLLDWVGHMINILVLTEKWRTPLRKPLCWNFCSLRSKNSNTGLLP